MPIQTCAAITFAVFIFLLFYMGKSLKHDLRGVIYGSVKVPPSAQ